MTIAIPEERIKSVDAWLQTQFDWSGTCGVARDLRSRLLAGLDGGSLDADSLLAGYCALLHQRHYTIEEVARRTNMDRRTVKRHLAMEQRAEPHQ